MATEEAEKGVITPTTRFLYTIRPLFKKITQHCKTYQPTNCCVRKLYNLCTILDKFI